MLRFSELELKEKEGGGAAVDLADSQRERREGDGDGGEDRARCQGPARTGPGASALTDEAEKDGKRNPEHSTHTLLPTSKSCCVLPPCLGTAPEL